MADETIQRAHALLEQLAPGQLAAIVHLLEAMIEPRNGSGALIPTEEESITPETAIALDRAKASLDRGEAISHDEILREFGLLK